MGKATLTVGVGGPEAAAVGGQGMRERVLGECIAETPSETYPADPESTSCLGENIIAQHDLRQTEWNRNRVLHQLEPLGILEHTGESPDKY